MSIRPHPADQEHTIERHALSIAVLHGPGVLSIHGLKYHHFSQTHSVLFHVLEIAARETPTGIPEMVRVQAMLSNEQDSGIPANEVPLAMLGLTEGTGEAHNAAWYAGRIIDGWKRRESIRITLQLQSIQNGDSDGDIQQLTSRLVELAGPNTDPDPTTINLANIRGCMLTGDQLMALHVPQRPRLLDDWLCRGDLGFIFAPRGVGKTWISMALPHAISAGEGLGLWTAGAERSSVLYLDGEMPLELSKARHTWLNRAGGNVAYLHHDVLFEKIGRTLNIAEPAHQEAITALMLKEERNFLVLDNLSCLASGVDENKGLAYEPISAWLLDLRRRKITVIMVHHAGREGFMRGHSKREDAASWILELRDAKDEGQEGARFVSHFAKPSRNTGKHMSDLLWHFTTDEAEARTAIHCEPAEESEYDTMLRHIADGVETVTDLAELMGKGKGTISKWIKRGEGAGRLTRLSLLKVL